MSDDQTLAESVIAADKNELITELSVILDKSIRETVLKFWGDCSGKFTSEVVLSATVWATGWAFINTPTGESTISRDTAHTVIDVLKDRFDSQKEAAANAT